MAKIVTNLTSNILKVLPSNEVEGKLAAQLRRESEEDRIRLDKGSMTLGGEGTTGLHLS